MIVTDHDVAVAETSTTNPPVMMNPPVTTKSSTVTQEARKSSPAASPATLSALPAFLTASDVAAVLRCSMRTVYRLADTGRIPSACHFGGLIRWNAAAFEAWIASGSPSCRQGKISRQ